MLDPIIQFELDREREKTDIETEETEEDVFENLKIDEDVAKAKSMGLNLGQRIYNIIIWGNAQGIMKK